MSVSEFTIKLLLIDWRSVFTGTDAVQNVYMAKPRLWFYCCVPSKSVCQKHGQWGMKHRSHSHWMGFMAQLVVVLCWAGTLSTSITFTYCTSSKKAELLLENLTLNNGHDSVQDLSREKWQQWWKRSLLRLHKYKQLRNVQDIFKLAPKRKVHALFFPSGPWTH